LNVITQNIAYTREIPQNIEWNIVLYAVISEIFGLNHFGKDSNHCSKMRRYNVTARRGIGKNERD